MDLGLSRAFVTGVLALAVGVALLVFSRFARRIREPLRGWLRLQAGDISFTEIFAMFALGYGLGSLVGGQSSQAGGPPGGRFIGGRFNPFSRADLALEVGAVFGLLTFLYRFDIIGRLTSSQSHRSVTAIIGAEAQALEDIPPGGHGQITFRDATGDFIGIIATADVHVPAGSRCRIVGRKGLNPVVALEG